MRIALDIDDTLAQFYPAACKYFGKEVVQTDIWDMDGYASFIPQNYEEILHNKKFWTNLEILSPPESINFDFFCYMTSLSVERFDERVRWIESNKYPNKPIIFTEDKISMCLSLGIDVIIDDKPQTIEEARSVGILGILFRPPYMTDNGKPCITDLREVTQFLEWHGVAQ